MKTGKDFGRTRILSPGRKLKSDLALALVCQDFLQKRKGGFDKDRATKCTRQGHLQGAEPSLHLSRV